MKKFFKIFMWALFALLVLLTFVFLWNKSRNKAALYSIETVQSNDSLQTETVLTGVIEPRYEVQLKPQMSGIVAELLHKPGDIVQAGEIIARLSVVPEMMQVNSGISRVKMAQINFDKTKEKYLRDEQLYNKGVIAKEEYEVSKATYEQQKEELASAQDALQIVRKGVSSRSAKESSTLVRATVSGKILTIPVKVGNSVIQANNFNDGTTIATIANMQDLIFVGNVDETEVGKLREGMAMKINIGAMENKAFDATIEYISPKGENKTGTTLFEIKGAITPNQYSNEIRAGYSANAKVITAKVDKAMSVPENAIIYRNDSTFVAKVKRENPLETEETAVTTGVSNGVRIEIKSGLKAGDKVKGAEIIKK